MWTQRVDRGDTLAVDGNPLKYIVDSYQITGTGSGPNFQFDAQKAMQIIWATAAVHLRYAEALYNGVKLPPEALPPPASTRVRAYCS